MAQPININPHTHVWKVQHGNPTNPDGYLHVDCVGKVTACYTAGELGFKRLFVATPVARKDLPFGTTIVKGLTCPA